MSTYQLSHLSDRTLLCELEALVTRDRVTTAALLAHIAEVDARKLYLPAAYPSMFAYCVGELRMSEDEAYKRIQAARAARRFPAVFEAVAEGRLHLSAVVLLAPHLTEETAGELLAAATHRSKSEIERLLAERFPRPDVLAWVAPVPGPSSGDPASPRPAGGSPVAVEEQLVPEPVQAPLAPERVGDRSRVKPLSAQSFEVRFTMSRSAHEKLHYAQELLGHQVPSGDIAQVFERALDVLIPRLEKAKFAATGKPRPCPGRSSDPRHIPADVKRAVWKRDQGRCTFIGDTGRRCPARTRLEFDHLTEVARGGKATVGGIRLRCRAHNQYTAECTFGVGFMHRKRREAQHAPGHAEARAEAAERAQVAADERARARAQAAEQARERDVIPWLRGLGFRADEARRAAAACESIPEASLEERVRFALSFLAPPHRRAGKGRAAAT